MRSVGKMVIVLCLFVGVVWGQQGVVGGEWYYYGGDKGSIKYFFLSQIDVGNVVELEIVWCWLVEVIEGEIKKGCVGDFKMMLLMVGGKFYFIIGL